MLFVQTANFFNNGGAGGVVELDETDPAVIALIAEGRLFDLIAGALFLLPGGKCCPGFAGLSRLGPRCDSGALGIPLTEWSNGLLYDINGVLHTPVGTILNDVCTALSTVPDVLGQTLVLANNAITLANLTPNTMTVQVCDDVVASGLVISSNPVASTLLLPGSPTTLTISTGPCP